MTIPRTPIPEGPVSTVRGRWQAPALTWLTRVLLVVAVASAVVPGRGGTVLAVGVVGVVVATPLLRVGWLVLRWTQERDWRFVVLGLALLAVVGIGAGLAAAGVGS